MSEPRREWLSGAYRLAADTIAEAEIAAAKDVLDSGYFTMGREVAAFEAEFAAWVGVKAAVMVNSGSSANLLITDALVRGTSSRPRLLPGDEVIVPGLAWPTTVWPLVQLGLVPVFADVDRDTLAISLESAASIAGPRTRGMMLIHPLGRAADMHAYREFCESRKLVLLEDCCESLGAHSGGAHVGTHSLAGSFSFYFSHHLSTIEGGMMITNDLALADDLRGLRAHGWIRERADRDQWATAHPELDARFLFATVGYNVRPTEIQAAIGRIQLRRLDSMLESRESLARRIQDWTEAMSGIELIGAETLDQPATGDRRARVHSWMTLPFRVLRTGSTDRDAVVRHLESVGVETRPIIAGNLARHPATRSVAHRSAKDMHVCDELLADTFMIGCHPVVSADSFATLERAVRSLAHL